MMALHTLPELGQGSPEWHDQRRGMVTASVVGQLLSIDTLGAGAFDCPSCHAEPDSPCKSVARGKANGMPLKATHKERTGAATRAAVLDLKPARNDTSRGLTALLVAERITGHTEPTWMNDDMLRGVMDEPRARDRYAETQKVDVTEIGFMVRDDWGWSLGYSPDGLVGDHGLIEVKSRRQKKQLQTILADTVPPENMAQLQAGLLVSGREWCDYISYCGGMPMFVKRVYPDPLWSEAIVDAVSAFEQTAEQMVHDYLTRTADMPTTERAEETDLGLVF